MSQPTELPYTVQDLIRDLQSMPQHLPVVISGAEDSYEPFKPVVSRTSWDDRRLGRKSGQAVVLSA